MSGQGIQSPPATGSPASYGVGTPSDDSYLQAAKNTQAQIDAAEALGANGFHTDINNKGMLIPVITGSEGGPLVNIPALPTPVGIPVPNQNGDATSNPQSTNKVNWLGSSYAGSDITIVAHLYQDLTDAANNKIQNDLSVANAVVLGARNCQASLPRETITAGSSNLSWQQIFNDACFGGAISDPITSQALSILQQNLGPFASGVLSGDPQVTGKFNIVCNNLATGYQAQANSLSDQNNTANQNRNAASSVLELGQCQTLSVQSHREKTAVRSLGRTFCNGYVRGPRTIAGSIIFTVFDEHPLSRLMRAMLNPNLFAEVTYNDYSSVMIDQLPPIDLTIVFTNEYGSISRMGIYGVEFVNDGTTMSIEDLFMEDVVQFVAKDIDIMTAVGMIKLSQTSQGIYNSQGQKLSGSSLYYSNYDAYNSYCTQQLGLSATLMQGNK